MAVRQPGTLTTFFRLFAFMRNSVLNSVLLFSLLLLFGTSGYVWLEDCSFLDGLYMTVITVTTVGYGEIIPLSIQGKLFTIVLILMGVGFVLFLFGRITEAIVEGGLHKILGKIKMQKKVARMKDHYIVCGFGRIGKVICQILKENHRPFLVIESDPEMIQPILALGYMVLEGKAANDDILINAGVKRAAGLIATASSDADNVYIALSARGLNSDLFIMARSSGQEGAETKLLRAGADKVISPYFIGATRMAQLLVRPTVVDFLDLTIGGGGLGLRLEELSLSENSRCVQSSLQDSQIRKKFDLIVVAIKRINGEMLFNPSPKTILQAGDTLVVLGEQDNIKGLVAEL